MKKSKLVGTIVILLVFAGGFYFGGNRHPAAGHDEHLNSTQTASRNSESATVSTWTCSMHPQVRQPKAGQCPICGMDLIPVAGEASEGLGPRELKLSEAAAKLAEIEVVPVERRIVQKEIRMVGKIDYDETRLAYITAWVSGRLDRLYVDYTGVPVKKGDHMVYIYSPDVLTAQAELLQSVRTVKELERSNLSSIVETARATVDASREKLRLWGLTTDQIKSIEVSGKTTDHITLYSPVGGIVIQKNATEGEYVQTGTRIYTVADLTQVWVKLDAYESDLPWLRYGQEIEFSAESYPGESFKGRIAFIDPVLNEKTRTVKIRVNVPNEHGKLKPNMFVRAQVQAKIAQGGRVIDAALAGRWISPMHPEIVKDGPGACDICGMPLVKAESLGFVAVDTSNTAVPLVIPVSAPLITGKRAVVYVQSPTDPSRFAGRVVSLGPRAGSYYIVDDGLAEGDLVVVNGNFKIDSALQIRAQPSMMNPAPHAEGSGTPAERRGTRGEVFTNIPADFSRRLASLFTAYLSIHDNLTQDQYPEAQTAARAFLTDLESVNMDILSDRLHTAWMTAGSELKRSAEMILKADAINSGRIGFKELSEAMIAVIRRFGENLPDKVVQIKCPMAFNNTGGIWLQNTQDVKNPYFGSAMLGCGEVVEVLRSPNATQKSGDKTAPVPQPEERHNEGSHMHEGSHH